jgi:hypothetical protein
VRFRKAGWMRLLPALLIPCALLSAARAVAADDAQSPAVRSNLCPAAGTSPVMYLDAVSASSFRTVDGREIKLAGVIGPGEDGEFANASPAPRRIALASVLSGHHLAIAITGSPDRYRRVPAQLFADGVWIQEAMVRQGWLRVSAEEQIGACAAPLLAAENQAIAEMAGYWRDGTYRVRTPDQLANRAGHFETVEGQIWQVRVVKGAGVIEFANASRFHLELSSTVVRQFRETRFDIRRLRARVIRVRGWIRLDRPSMEISNPVFIEIRDGQPTRGR